MTAPSFLPTISREALRENIKPTQAPPTVLPFIEAKHPIWIEHHEHWDREEKRLYGGDPVLDDLTRFDWEQAGGAHFLSRKAMAHYINLPRIHAELVVGHVSKKRPKPGAGLDFGSLGEVRERDQATGPPTRAEMAYYNVDGIGQDGKEWAAWWDGVYQRAEATGFRWVMVESPRFDPALLEILTLRAEIEGARPYLVEYSPIRVPTWWYHNGELEFAMLRPTVDEPYMRAGSLWMPQLSKRGWYLLVRRGCTILGDEYADGGWWLWDSLRTFIDSGTWDQTDGRIPMFPVFSEADPGTDTHPAIARSQTMELGQCAVGMMNLISARDYDAFNAAMSKTFMLGVDPQTFEVIVERMKDSQLIPVPGVPKNDGTLQVPTVYDGSQGAVASNVFKTILDAKLVEAKQAMIEKVTSSETASGAKQAASFAEASAPLLVRRARFRQDAESMAIYFLEQRWGQAPKSGPTGFAIYPDEYELAPLIDAIDAQLDTLRRATAILPAKSASLIVDLIIKSLFERGLMPDDVSEAQLRTEMMASIEQAQAMQQPLMAPPGAGLNPLTRPGSTVPGETLPPVPTQAPSGAPKPKPAQPPSGNGKAPLGAGA